MIRDASGRNQVCAVTWHVPSITLDLARADADPGPPGHVEMDMCSDVGFQQSAVIEFLTAEQVLRYFLFVFFF